MLPEDIPDSGIHAARRPALDRITPSSPSSSFDPPSDSESGFVLPRDVEHNGTHPTLFETPVSSFWQGRQEGPQRRKLRRRGAAFLCVWRDQCCCHDASHDVIFSCGISGTHAFLPSRVERLQSVLRSSLSYFFEMTMVSVPRLTGTVQFESA